MRLGYLSLPFVLLSLIATPLRGQAPRPGPTLATRAADPVGEPEISTVIFDLGTDSIDIGGEVQTSLLTGEAKRSRWTKRGTDDAFLVLDATALRAAGWTVRTPNGALMDGPHLFRTGLRLTGPDGEEVVISDGWQFFTLLDRNRDGRINSEDPEYRLLRLFVDEDGDGKMGPGELMYLRGAGVADIIRVRRQRPQVDAHMNYKLTGKFIGADGVMRVMIDVRLADAAAAPFADAFKQ
ncbi:MAG TPA: hypothetical protein VJ672_15495 [Gemmatimonadaceae bacterium]|nr:hypothetical protein [Gemmatimonadaceae bacterium]